MFSKTLTIRPTQSLLLDIPQDWTFEPDEVQVWYVRGETQWLLCQDSWKYDFQPGTAWVLDQFYRGRCQVMPLEESRFTETAFSFYQQDKEDPKADTFLQVHGLWDSSGLMTWLFATPAGDAALEIGHCHAFGQEPYGFQVFERVAIPQEAFLSWLEPLVQGAELAQWSQKQLHPVVSPPLGHSI